MKNKILILLLLLGSVFSFGFIPVYAQAEFVDDNTFVISNSDLTLYKEDTIKFFEFLFDYVQTYDLFEEDVNEQLFYVYLNNDNYGGEIDFNADLLYLDYFLQLVYYPNSNLITFGMIDYNETIVFKVDWNRNTDEIQISDIASYEFSVVITLPEPEPPFTGLINFIKNLLDDLLKNITDMTMSLINNIWDTNLIDINLVVLSDTPIYSGTLNDTLYSVFSIFYVIFAITLVWRVLRKIIRKMFFWDRW